MDQYETESKKLSVTKEDLSELLNSPNYTPEKLVDLFKKDFPEIYSADAGVWEKYTIAQHTQMVLTQFEKYFSNLPLPANIDPNFFRTVLALHDIGKPKAINLGNKLLQHTFTSQALGSILPLLGFNTEQVNLAKTLVNGDFIGESMKGYAPKLSAFKIKDISKTSGVDIKDFFEILLIYYKVDAGSYTQDAGGKQALDHLFIFDHINRKLNFAPPQQKVIDNLKEELEII